MLETASHQQIDDLLSLAGTDVPRVQVRNVAAGTFVRVVTVTNLTYLIEIVDPDAPTAHVVLCELPEDGIAEAHIHNCMISAHLEVGSTIRCGDGETPLIIRVVQLH